MKHKKKYISVGIALASMCLIAASFMGNTAHILPEETDDTKVVLLNQHIFQTNTNFHISETGEARVYVDYAGYDTVQGAEITVQIAKKGMFIFWDTIISETHTVSGEYYYHAYHYDVKEAGTYRCTVIYKVIDEDGKNDIVTFDDIVTFSGASESAQPTETTAQIVETTVPEETTMPTETEETTARPKPNVELLKREFIYDENGRYAMSVDYDENGNKLREIDYTTDGAKTEEREYFENGRLKRVFSYQGAGHETTSYIYYESGKLWEVTKNTAGSTRYHTTIYDEEGTVSCFRIDIINCEGITTKTSYYDRYGKFTGYCTYSYDDFGRPLRYTRYDGNQMKVSYLDHIYDYNGHYIKSVLYDARGNLIAEEYPD